MKYDRANAHQKKVVGIHLDILIFAVRTTAAFGVSTIVESVADISKSSALIYLKILINLGYIEKVSCSKYQATKFAKQMFGVESAT